MDNDGLLEVAKAIDGLARTLGWCTFWAILFGLGRSSK